MVRRGVGAERQPVLLGLLAQPVEDDAGLDARESSFGVDLEHAVEVLREVDHDRDVDRLPGEARPAAARRDRRLVLAARVHRRDHVVDRTRYDDADRQLPVVRAGRRVERPIAVGEADLALDRRTQRGLERRDPFRPHRARRPDA